MARSVADLKAIFEKKFITQQHELIKVPKNENKDWKPINDEQKHIDSIRNDKPGKISWNPPVTQTVSKQTNVGRLNLDSYSNDQTQENSQQPKVVNKLALDNKFTGQLNSCLKGQSQKDSEEKAEQLISKVYSDFVFDIYESNRITTEEGSTLVSGIGSGGCYYTVVTSTTGFDTGIHEWEINFLANGHYHSNPGVIASLEKLTSIQRSHYALKNMQGSKPINYLYIWHDYDEQLQGFHSGVLTTTGNSVPKISVNDVIKVVLNCDKDTIAFYRNGVNQGSMKLPPNQTYYPCLFTCDCVCQKYKLLAKEQNQI